MSIMPRLRNLIAYSAILGVMASCAAMAATRNSMHEFRFKIEEYELSFTVPKAFLSDMWNRPDHYDPEWKKGGQGEGHSATYFFHIHMLKGPFWVGNYAAMDFTVQIFETDTEYHKSVSSLDELIEYQEWTLISTNDSESYDYSIKTISGSPWLQMTLQRRESERTGRRDDENTILLFPLGNRRYLQVLCRITELIPDKTGRWLPDAHKIRDQILDSIVLRKVN